jgi:hypothetical protein
MASSCSRSQVIPKTPANRPVFARLISRSASRNCAEIPGVKTRNGQWERAGIRLTSAGSYPEGRGFESRPRYYRSRITPTRKCMETITIQVEPVGFGSYSWTSVAWSGASIRHQFHGGLRALLGRASAPASRSQRRRRTSCARRDGPRSARRAPPAASRRAALRGLACFISAACPRRIRSRRLSALRPRSLTAPRDVLSRPLRGDVVVEVEDVVGVVAALDLAQPLEVAAVGGPDGVVTLVVAEVVEPAAGRELRP